ncbi:MAG: NADH-quinone oxidoreductase subunit NuoD, partial [candidate division Zixibacteria bacterium]|nr:NADH-quinone oxidoreductase subunit C [candidate division Zixibacteria bacterium]NIR68284.1 NADH-quinone oxidoreductase subunit C [candidate division Zixibacteria bacterium]NIS49452.1 NADH-quinone oxidoreductase subunit C [candidate division Zixibacteria bacterium]NIU17533.1 NADH-quinone oxidoreductase subunit C [candidate division Zixibacteria bacterium]NIV09682.1 NADH-quinone oxidoreductase subunit NuoD [candidate division Zixibacteria bacterium]
MVDQYVMEDIALEKKFPSGVRIDDRDGYEGYIIEADQLLEIAEYIRDEMGYDFLSSVTGVDYIDDQMMEVVYHAFQSTGGEALVFKAQTPRDKPVVPSLVPIYPGADFQEREIWDLFGIKFEGHPDLRRILMWEGFNGHPMRKDWKEAYYEEDGKPFDKRWPEGSGVYRAEDNNPYGKNVEYPAGLDPYDWEMNPDEAIYAGL